MQLIAVGNKMPTWVDVAYKEYARRLSGVMPLELVEIPAEKRTKQVDIARLLKKEGHAMLAAVHKGNKIVSLDIPGAAWTTPQLARHIQQWSDNGQNISLLIGGPEGLSPECKIAAQQSWSLSPLTLPHPMVRVIVAESLFRGWSITVNHPYHRE